MPLDYEKIGLKAGLEIHQQLDTNKLFCNCPSTIRDDSPDYSVKRFLRASAGETGKIDIAAKAETEKKKQFIYEGYHDTNCLVELDESPPLNVNKDSLNVVLELSLLTDAEIVDEIHVMRKTVVDGSNTSGFQRTALVARNGLIEVSMPDGKAIKVNVDTLCLEEDAARIISRNSDQDIYRLDRLGIPLIEIATGPNMHTPQEVKETAAYLGMLLRSTGKVKRGLGTIRQDVNVSVSGGSRVEIKGVQDLRLIDTVVELEAVRQLSMLKLREEMIAKGITTQKIDSLLAEDIKEYTDKFRSLDKGFIKAGITSGLEIYGKSYKLFNGFFGYEINPNRRFGSELSDRIKLFGLNGLIHTDENLEKYGISEIVKNIYSDLDLRTEDGMIFILGSRDKCMLAFKKIDETIRDFILSGLSKEVRNAKDDGTSQYLRPMPGSSRMYPETDIQAIYADISKIKKPELLKDKIERFAKNYSLPKQVAKELVLEPNFEIFVKKYPQIKPVTIAESLDSSLKDIKTRYNVESNPTYEQYDQIFSKLNSGEISKEAVFEILLGIGKGEHGKIIDFSKYQTNEEEVGEFIVKMIADHPNLNENAIMGMVMKEYRGRFPGSKILELIKKFKVSIPSQINEMKDRAEIPDTKGSF
ncbi:MAG TPA: Glu-tRNA(Gln) amidotransferase subunit GatE [Alphaproteobacteria bacterium]|nr:Glu-tRNA(Gln) amidotransferase subunit GatE [Alphaproteobacteria bacterium]